MRSESDPLVIAGQTVAPGEEATIPIPVPRLLNRSELSMSARVIHGRQSGPRLLVCGAIHGDEVNGVEIVLRLLRRKGLRKLRGALICVPVVNVYGFLNGSRYLPDNRDLNRSFPGSPSGSLASRLAKLFIDGVVSQATHVIDLHTGARHRSNVPQVRAVLNDPENRRLADAFGAPVLIDAKLREGSLRETADSLGIPMLVYETGEALRMDYPGVRAGVNGILSVMHELGMIPKAPRMPHVPPFVAQDSSWTRAPVSGIFRTNKKLGQALQKGEDIGSISDPFGDEVAAVTCTRHGVIIGKSNIPLVHQGDPLVHIAHFERPDSVASAVEDYQIRMEEELLAT